MIIIKLLLIDGNSIINRAFYGIKLLTTKDGKYTNGIFGFLNILLSLLDSIKPDAVVAAFDLKGPTFRHEMYEGYKAQRKGMPDELAQQLPVLKDLLRAFGYKVIEKEGYEADDIIGTLSDKSGAECYIATGDRDSLQLVNDRVKVILASTKAGSPVSTVYDEAKILEEYSVSPERLIDIKALMGDSSDNIPGVAGIGQKTACSLVAKYGSLEEIYDKIEELEVSPSVKTKLKEGRDSAFLSYKLGTIEKAVPISHKAEDYLPDKRDETRLAGLLTSLEMYKMLDRLGLKAASLPAAEEKIQTLKTLRLVTDFDAAELIKRVKESKKLYLNIDSIDNKINRFCVNCDDSLYFKLLDNQDAQNLLKGCCLTLTRRSTLIPRRLYTILPLKTALTLKMLNLMFSLRAILSTPMCQTIRSTPWPQSTALQSPKSSSARTSRTYMSVTLPLLSPPLTCPPSAK